ncbi:fumarylacetoacetate hydrolase family protein [Luteitalea sp.]|jgi:2-keto-4-pentenoate hydratase/2-oxohepta-3-ene-1,7-dioic acid hydratase in catechol pathway|uniref:fumarylacetoacetate hydrolase family protein n=1 Tax=Luteitalea sp. TaxID=2004800 RepID=UPI0037C60440
MMAKIVRTPDGYVVEEGGVYRALEGDLFGAWRAGAEVPAPTRVLAPVTPSKIVCIGLNYKDHAAEQGKPLPAEPLIFLKPSTAIVAPGEPIVIPEGVGRVDYESELAVVIGRRATRVAEAAAMTHVLGYTCMNDVTARELQKKDGRYTRAKGFDTFAPLGPCIATGLSPADLRVTGTLNGTVKQDSSTRELIFPVASLIAYISRIMTLLPGDIVSTGTPAGIGPLQPGDEIVVEVEGIGALRSPVIAQR